jgi:hypothetical protein
MPNRKRRTTEPVGLTQAERHQISEALLQTPGFTIEHVEKLEHGRYRINYREIGPDGTFRSCGTISTPKTWERIVWMYQERERYTTCPTCGQHTLLKAQEATA